MRNQEKLIMQNSDKQKEEVSSLLTSPRVFSVNDFFNKYFIISETRQRYQLQGTPYPEPFPADLYYEENRSQSALL